MTSATMIMSEKRENEAARSCRVGVIAMRSTR